MNSGLSQNHSYGWWLKGGKRKTIIGPQGHILVAVWETAFFGGWGDEGMGNHDWNDKELGVLSVKQV